VSQVAQSVQWLATSWTTRRSRFDPWQRRKDFSSNMCVQTVSGVHPTSSTMGTGSPFQGLKRGRGLPLTTHPHLVSRSRMSRSYTSSPPSAFVVCCGTALALGSIFWHILFRYIEKQTRKIMYVRPPIPPTNYLMDLQDIYRGWTLFHSKPPQIPLPLIAY
jgi:hypothetical protein